MSVAYYVALPFVVGADGVAAGQAQECPNEHSAIRQAEAMSRKPPNVGALGFNVPANLTWATSQTQRF